MIHLKTEKEIEIMREGGKRLKRVVAKLFPKIREGAITEEIDREAERLITAEDGSPSFKQVKGYHWSICIPINEQVVHTPPSRRVIQKGDVVTLDMGMFFKGFHTDWATTLLIGESNKNIEEFLRVGRDALSIALKKVQVGSRLGEVSRVLQEVIYGNGYFILKELTGHGVGRNLHEDPYVPGYINDNIKDTLRIEPGLVLAVEVIYSMGTEHIAQEKGSRWSITTEDKSISACFEETIVATANKSFILT